MEEAAELVLVTSFWFYDHGTLFEDQHLLGRDEMHFSKQEKDIFENKMTDFERRALNCKRRRGERM